MERATRAKERTTCSTEQTTCAKERTTGSKARMTGNAVGWVRIGDQNMEAFGECPFFTAEPDPDSDHVRRHSESSFEFYERCPRPEIVRVRNLIEKFYQEFPACDRKASLLSQMRASDDEFVSGYFELYLYALLTRTGCQVEPEPVADKSMPDFLITLPSGQKYYVEAATIFGKSRTDRAIEAQLKVLYDYVDDNLISQKFFWGIEIVTQGHQPPSAKKIVAKLQDCANHLEYDDFLDWDKSDYRYIRSRQFEFGVEVASNGWTFFFSPFPKKESAFNTKSRPLGLFPMEGGISLTRQQLRELLSTKRRQHRDLEFSQIIAISAQQVDVDQDDLEGAVYGSEAFRIHYDASYRPIASGLIRTKDGFWEGHDGAKNSNIPLILFVNHLSPSSVGRVTPRVFQSPFADLDSLGLIPRLQLFNITGKVADGDSPAILFQLPDTWPEEN